MDAKSPEVSEERGKVPIILRPTIFPRMKATRQKKLRSLRGSMGRGGSRRDTTTYFSNNNCPVSKPCIRDYSAFFFTCYSNIHFITPLCLLK